MLASMMLNKKDCTVIGTSNENPKEIVDEADVNAAVGARRRLKGTGLRKALW